MTFENALKFLKEGEVIRRSSYPKRYVIFLQIPVDISAELAMGIKSIPRSMKLLLLGSDCGIGYEHQFIIYDFVTEKAHNYTFNCNDLCADDWEVVDISTNYKYIE